MGKIITPRQISEIKNLPARIILVGGCFDILHTGHIDFLARAKDLGDILVVMLEPDEKIKQIKGEGRPINLQNDRAAVLSNLSMVDFVLKLPFLKNEENYAKLVKKIEPDIIAVTPEDRVYFWENEYKIKKLKRTYNHSTTEIIKKIRK